MFLEICAYGVAMLAVDRMTTFEEKTTMPRPSWHTALTNSIVISGVLLGWTNFGTAQSQPIADDTLGNERSVVVPLGSNAPSDRISGGARRGDNLFHSFQEFGVDPGRSVYFSDPGVNNIITRVTGGTTSQIDGVLGVLGNANLFLINPNGIIFGANARLDVRGSFTATTADAIEFGDRGNFSAINPTAVPLLTVQPSAFVFNQSNPAPIANNSVASAETNSSGLARFGLQVPQGEDLTLLGGNISMDGGEVNALGGRVEIGGLGAPGKVSRNADGSLEFPLGVALADVSLTNQSRINVAADGGGSITINAGDFEILKESVLSAGISRNSGFVGAQAGDITLNADTIRGGESARIRNRVGVGGIGNAGNINIFADSLSLTDGVRLNASTLGEGNAGDVIIDARESVFLNDSAIFSNVGDVDVNRLAVGNGGDIIIKTGFLSLTNGAQIIAGTLGQGDSGDVIINARDFVSLDGKSYIFSDVGDVDVNRLAVGNGGDVIIKTGFLSLTNGAQLIAGTLGQGDSGDVIINARNFVSLDGKSAIFSDVGDVNTNGLAVGNGGNIVIKTGFFSLTNGAQLIAGTSGQGNSGNVIINARDRVTLQGVSQQENQTGILTDTLVGAKGRGGNVTINTDSISITDGALVNTETKSFLPGGSVSFNANTFEATGGGQVVTATNSSGQAGNITLNIADRITLSGVNPNEPGSASGLYASTNRNSSGTGGTVQITTGKLQVFDGATIAVNSQGSGIAGNIDIAANRVQLNNRSRLSAETTAVNGGNITLRDLRLLQLRNSSLISTTAGTDRSGGNGGNIDINADLIVAFPRENSDIRANAFTGSGGNVRIATQGLFGIAFQAQDNPFTSDITASSELGVQGNVFITLPDVDPRHGLTQLPEEVVDVSSRIAQDCRSNSVRQERGGFIVKGRGGLPPSPTDSLIGDEWSATWVTLEQTSGRVTSTNALPIPEPRTAAAPIVEAQGWIVNKNGNVQLIATAPTSTAQVPVICQRQENK